ncbi:MAG: winged helix-turn-helix transcriptional regulator [Candidatus Hodarchaeota archaeon]
MSLNTVDKSLLVELTKNCRISFSALASQNEISTEEVIIRINHLVRSRVILKFTVAPAISLFGAKDAIILFRSSKHPLDLDRLTLLGVNSTVEYISLGNLIEGFALIHYRSLNELNEVVEYFQQIHPSFEEIIAYPVQPFGREPFKFPTKDLLAFEKIDWLILAHLREQGRLSLNGLSIRTKFSVETLAERLEFLRKNNLIEETIHFNPAKTKRENWTIFNLELTLFTTPLQKELTRQLESFSTYWQPSCWKVIDQHRLLLGFLCSSYTEVEKIQAWLSDILGVKSIDKVMGGPTYFFPDFRDELIEEKRSHGWFSPEQWVVGRG